ncbi:hypothetical protein TIFTF001_016649 [Ficus carica]|uniref:40S ribosomal protein S11 n=1 Tax=Ficus carica TaxID=3494 RepID=A0AA88DA19_FICCA|nr:hypothetical protein TIFTF001_016649 [Ficus carica]
MAEQVASRSISFSLYFLSLKLFFLNLLTPPLSPVFADGEGVSQAAESVLECEENFEGEETWKRRESVLEEHWFGFQDTQRSHSRYEKRHSNIPAHISPCFRVKEGDHVTIGQCRPLSKTVRFNVLKVVPAGSSGGGKKAFTGMLNRKQKNASLVFQTLIMALSTLNFAVVAYLFCSYTTIFIVAPFLSVVQSVLVTSGIFIRALLRTLSCTSESSLSSH